MISDPDKNSVALSTEVKPEVTSLTVPVPSLSSLRKLFAHLEMISLKEKGRLPVFTGSQTSEIHGNRPPHPSCLEAPGCFTTLDGVALQVLKSSQAANDLVIARIEAMQLLILINRWPVIRRMWIDLIPDFKLTMLQLFYLQDLCNLDFAKVRLGHLSLESHWATLGDVQREIKETLDSEVSRVELSNLLEQKLLPWLRTLADHIDVIENEINRKKN